MIGHDFGGQQGRSKLGQHPVGLSDDLVDISTDDHHLRIGEQRLNRLNGLPETQATGNGSSRGRNQRAVQPVDVKGEVTGPESERSSSNQACQTSLPP